MSIHATPLQLAIMMVRLMHIARCRSIDPLDVAQGALPGLVGVSFSC